MVFSSGDFNPDWLIQRQAATKILSNAYLQLVGRPFPFVNTQNNQQRMLSNIQTPTVQSSNDYELFVASESLLALRWLVNGTLNSNLDCHLYAVHENSEGSQLFKYMIDGSQSKIEPFGPLQAKVDLTAIEINPLTQHIYALSSQTSRPSQLFMVDPFLGELFLLGEIKNEFGESLINVNGLEFTLDGSLIAYTNDENIRDYGLIQIDPHTGEFTRLLHINHRIYALAQHPESGNYWIATQRFIYVVNNLGNVLKNYVINTTGKIEAMDFQSNNQLLLSMSKNQASTLYEMNVSTEIVSSLQVPSDENTQTILSVAWPTSCTNQLATPSKTVQQFLPIISNN